MERYRCRWVVEDSHQCLKTDCRLEPFFRLPGRVVWDRDTVWVTLDSFNDRQLTRDLAAVYPW